MMTSTMRMFGGAILSAIVLGCASTPASESTTPAPSAQPSGADVIQVTVAHGGASGGNVTVYAEPAAGVRSAIGGLDPGDTKTFPYRVQGGNRRIRLIAINSTGQEIRSEYITVPQGAGVSWNMQINAIRVR